MISLATVFGLYTQVFDGWGLASGQRVRCALTTAMYTEACYETQDGGRRLVVGSTLFGAGWGLAGFCPGPAIVAVGLMQTKAVIFTLAMLAGMAIFEWLDARRAAAIRGR